MERKIFQVIISNFGAWNEPLEDQEEEEERWKLGELEVKGCHLRRGGQKKVKAVNLEHSIKANVNEANNYDLAAVRGGIFGQLDRSLPRKRYVPLN